MAVALYNQEMKRAVSFSFLAILLLSLFLQFYHLGERSLWEDEARNAIKSNWRFERILSYQKNIVFNLLLFSWSRLGKNEFWLRIPSVLFALFSLVALFELGRRFFSEGIALSSCLLLSTSPFFLLESRQVKMYSLALLFALASTYYLMSFLETGRFGRLLIHLGTSFLASLTHYMFFSLYLTQLVFLTVTSFKKSGAWAKRSRTALILLLFLFLPLLPGLLERMGPLRDIFLDSRTAESLLLPFGYFGKIALVYYLFTAGPTLFPWNVFWALPALALPLFLIVLALRKAPRNTSHILVFVSFFVPTLFLSFLRNAQPRYSFISLPFYALGLGIALFHLRPFWRTFCVSALLVIQGYGLMNYYEGRQYLFIAYLEPYREIVQQVRSALKPGDVLLHSQINPSFDYYLYRVFKEQTPFQRLHWADYDRNIHMEAWGDIQKKFHSGTQRLWFIERPPGQSVGLLPISDPGKIHRENILFREWLDHHFRRLDRKTYLKDSSVGQKKRFVPKFYSEERIVVSLYDLQSPP